MDEKRLLLGDRIRQTRRARGISQIQLAEMAQISVSHMSDIETGKTNISLDVFIRIMNALQVSSDWLLQRACPGCDVSGTAWISGTDLYVDRICVRVFLQDLLR